MSTIVVDTRDLYEFFVAIDMPGVRKEAARVVVGVHTASADVAADFMQAAFNPSAGQQALQAGEAAVPPGQAFMENANMMGAINDMTGMMRDLIQSQTTVNGTMGNFVLKLDHVITAQTALEAEQAAQKAAQAAQMMAQKAAEKAQAQLQLAMTAVQKELLSLKKKRKREGKKAAAPGHAFNSHLQAILDAAESVEGAEGAEGVQSVEGAEGDAEPERSENAPHVPATKHVDCAPMMAAPQPAQKKRGRKLGSKNKNRKCYMCGFMTPIAQPCRVCVT